MACVKISKEVAIDCVVEVARENEYDPVRAYLEHCANTVDAPAYIDQARSLSHALKTLNSEPPSTTT